MPLIKIAIAVDTFCVRVSLKWLCNLIPVSLLLKRCITPTPKQLSDVSKAQTCTVALNFSLAGDVLVLTCKELELKVANT